MVERRKLWIVEPNGPRGDDVQPAVIVGVSFVVKSGIRLAVGNDAEINETVDEGLWDGKEGAVTVLVHIVFLSSVDYCSFCFFILFADFGYLLTSIFLSITLGFFYV